MQRPHDAGHAPDQPADGTALAIPFAEFVALTALLIALTAMSIDIMLPALPEIGRALHVATENDRQLVVIVYMVGFSAGQLIYGPLSDHLGRKPVLLAGLAIFVAGTLGALLSSSFTALLLARLVQGFGAASPRVVAIAVVRDLFSGRQMARVMSFAMMVFIVIPVLAPSVGQALLQVGSWRWAFVGLLAVGLLAALWAGLRLPETGKAATGQARPLPLATAFRTAVLDPATAGYGAATGFMFGCLLSYVASSQQIFVETFGLGAAFPIAFGAIASVMAAASLVNARYVGRWGMRRLSHYALAAFVVTSLALAAAAALGIATLPVFSLLVAAVFFLFGLVTPNFNALAMESQGHNAGMASSVVGSLSTAIGAMVGAFVGHAYDGTVLPMALGFAAASLIAATLVVAIEGRAGLFGGAGGSPR